MRTECNCLMSGPKGAELVRAVGTDETNGRYADVSIRRCPACGQLWLRYFVEYEGFSSSSRWAEGMIDEDRAATMKPEEAADFLGQLLWCITGGSAWGGPKRDTGPFRWDF